LFHVHLKRGQRPAGRISREPNQRLHQVNRRRERGALHGSKPLGELEQFP
jgi:hypothetical protein